MSSHIFPSSHFETARQFEVESFADEESRIIAELSLTLPFLQRENGVLGFDLDQLSAYHMLHYGAERPEVCAAATMIMEGGVSEELAQQLPTHIFNKMNQLQDILKGALKARYEVSGSLAFGRIALSENCLDIPEQIEESTTFVEASEAGKHTGRPELFLYPNEDIALSYAGLVPTWDKNDVQRLAADHPPLEAFVNCHLDAHSLEGLDFHKIKLRDKEISRFFLAVASEFEIGGIDSFVPEKYTDLYEGYDKY